MLLAWLHPAVAAAGAVQQIMPHRSIPADNPETLPDLGQDVAIAAMVRGLVLMTHEQACEGVSARQDCGVGLLVGPRATL